MELVTWPDGRAARTTAIDGQPKKLITWSDKLAVGVRVIDEQHIKLIEIINQLSDSMYSGRSQNMLFKVLMGLEMYALYHFDTEEKLMIEHKYAESEEHKLGHDIFTGTVKEFRHKFDSGQAVISSELMSFLREWLIVHIMQTDKKFGLTLNHRGVG